MLTNETNWKIHLEIITSPIFYPLKFEAVLAGVQKSLLFPRLGFRGCILGLLAACYLAGDRQLFFKSKKQSGAQVLGACWKQLW